MAKTKQQEQTSGDLVVTRYPVADLRTYHRNPRHGDVAAIQQSLRVNTQYKPIVVNVGTHTGRANEVLTGNHTLKAAREEGWEHIQAVTLDVDDDQAARIVAGDNRTSDLGSYDDHLLAQLLADLDDLTGTGYDPSDLDALQHKLRTDDYDDERSNEYNEGSATPPAKRTMPLDLIFSWRPDTALALIAAQMGWGLGCISTGLQSARSLFERYPNAPRITFMDNEWHGYDHTLHRDAVAEIKPTYATVRDLVTREQATEADVEWYSVEHTLEMAEEIAGHTDNVILIPKYDCLDQLPERIGGARVVLGYSVESSYGGTPLPIKSMQGRPIHLLGGPWKKQRAYLNLMADDIVSIDNNNFCNIAQWANVTMPGGEGRNLADLLGHPVHRAFYGAAVCSMASIASTIIEDYGVTLADQQITAPEPAGEETRG